MRSFFEKWEKGDLVDCFDYFVKGVITSFLVFLMFMGIASLGLIVWCFLR